MEAQNDDAVVQMKKMLTDLDGGNVEVILKNIQEALKAKTYLLVLDNVWNEDQHTWEDFIKSWSGITSTKGNGILVTTRNEGVGSLVKTLDKHLLNGLSEEQCWSIIKDRAFERGSITPDLQDIGRNIAKRCQGLPLAADVVGGVLRGKSLKEWRSINENWLSSVGGDVNGVSRILRMSFHHLPSSSHKKCFAYCSIFPKGARIQRVQLIELWMAEGFIQPSSDMETVGNQFLQVLLHNSLLQVVDRDEYGEIEHCSMHDLVHDVAIFISDAMYYKRDASSQIPKKRAKQYICWGCNGDESSRIPKVQAKWLRTLIYNGRICDIVFSDFKSLHALTLTDDDVKKLTSSIRELIHLRYLDSIGKLSHLQTIRYLHPRWRTRLKKLPSTIRHLLNLRHLYMADDDTKLPPQLGMLTSLQTLPCFKVRNKEGHRIVELGSMKNLKGELKIYNLQKVQGEEESKKAYLSQKSGIVRLVLRWGESTEGEIINDENVLKGLQPHPNIKMLGISGFNGARFPTWALKMAVCLEDQWVALNSLTEIRLSSCAECEEIPMLGHLPNLKSLYLFDLEKVKCLGASFYGTEDCSSSKETFNVFAALERLELKCMPELREWEEVKIPSGAQVKVFPCLEYLKISHCNQMQSAPSQFTSLKELDVDSMDSELALASICGFKLKTLTKLKIESIEGLICLPDWLFHNNQDLSKLEIHCCRKLKELPDGLHSLNSLEELKLSYCDNLKSIPCSISGMKLQGLTSLSRLSIWKCPVLISFFGEMESCAPLLEDLSIDAGGSEALDCVSFNNVVDGILRFRSHSLLRLDLTGREDWESLPDQLQHLTALVHLRLGGLGIEELPEWFCNLSSLQELSLSECRKLKNVTSMEAMGRLGKLTINIRQCPLLQDDETEQQSGDDGDSDCPFSPM